MTAVVQTTNITDGSGDKVAANFATLNLTQVGLNTLITTGADSIQLDNITLANLHASDFVFF